MNQLTKEELVTLNRALSVSIRASKEYLKNNDLDPVDKAITIGQDRRERFLKRKIEKLLQNQEA